MTRHALERLNERYGNKFTMDDINIINTLIKKGLYLEIVKDFVDRDGIIVLLRYNNTPMKLVYSKGNKRIITVLPLDIDEYNQYIAVVPDINTNSNYSQNSNEETLKIRNKFKASINNKEIDKGFNLEEQIKNETKFYIRSGSSKFIILWFKKDKNTICYQLYSRKA